MADERAWIVWWRSEGGSWRAGAVYADGSVPADCVAPPWPETEVHRGVEFTRRRADPPQPDVTLDEAFAMQDEQAEKGERAWRERLTTHARFCNREGCPDSWHVGGNYGSHVCRNPDHHDDPQWRP